MDLQPSRIIRSRRRSVALEIRDDATFVVRAPTWVGRAFIDAFIRERSSWLERELAAAGAVRARVVRKYEEGECFPFLGVHYSLRFVSSGRALSLDTEFRLPVRLRQKAKETFERWYRREAGRYLAPRVHELARLHGFEPTGVRITGARTNWGSCGPKGGLNFTWRLIMAPRFVVDYVIIHELAHLRQRNHSAAFWRLVQGMCPELKEAKKWLNENGRGLLMQ